MEDLTGKQLGQYQLVAPLGEGGMAVVYKAYQPSMERYVAIKILPRQYAADQEFVRRFKQEAKIIANLEHPNILPVYDYGETDGYAYLVMRYIEGGKTLADLLEGQHLPLSQICEILSKIAASLDYAHAHGVVHRDIKPSNVLIDQQGNLLLSDFGVAKMLLASTKLTASGAFIGTPTYASPEQCLGKQDIDGRSDVYSLGVMLYEMAVGRPPFDAETPMAVVIKHISDPLPSPRKLNPILSEGVERVILKGLAKEPGDRYQTAGEMAKALEMATQRAATPVPILAPNVQTATGKSGWSKWGLVLGCLAVLGLVVGGIVVGISMQVAKPKNTATATYTAIMTRTPIATTTNTNTHTLTPIPSYTITPTYTDAPRVPTSIPTRTHTSIPTLGIGSTLISQIDGMVMVYVPAGEFLMGSNDYSIDEQPAHTVYLDDFWIDQTEVTNAMYAKCVANGQCQSIGCHTGSQYQDHPVVCVSWADSQTYCAWAGRRLPTEAEWEKAARGIDGRLYPWGDNSPSSSLMNFNQNIGDTTVVGSYPAGASPYGALDMAGNVWEWVNDWYDENYYVSSPARNPQGPNSGDSRILRGGSWYLEAQSERAANRNWYTTDIRGDVYGFRCVSSP